MSSGERFYIRYDKIGGGVLYLRVSQEKGLWSVGSSHCPQHPSDQHTEFFSIVSVQLIVSTPLLPSFIAAHRVAPRG